MTTVFFTASLAFLGLSVVTYLRFVASSAGRTHKLAFRTLTFLCIAVLLACAAGVSSLATAIL